MMGSNYFGKTNTGSSSSSPPPPSSSRRSKKGGNSEKPKQPQRGLGVAQLEKIRLHEEMGCCFNLPSTNFIHGDPSVQAAYSSSMELSSPSSSLLPRSLSSSARPSYSFQHNFTVGESDYGTTDIMHGDSRQPTTATSWRLDNIGISERFQFSRPEMHNPNLEDSLGMKSNTRLIGKPFVISRGRSSESSENNQEVDLELRLSL